MSLTCQHLLGLEGFREEVGLGTSSIEEACVVQQFPLLSGQWL